MRTGQRCVEEERDAEGRREGAQKDIMEQEMAQAHVLSSHWTDRDGETEKLLSEES